MKFIIKDNSQEPKMLPMEGRAQNGDYYQVNSKYLIKNGSPFLPVMGEFHFSCWHPDEWKKRFEEESRRSGYCRHLSSDPPRGKAG